MDVNPHDLRQSLWQRRISEVVRSLHLVQPSLSNRRSVATSRRQSRSHEPPLQPLRRSVGRQHGLILLRIDPVSTLVVRDTVLVPLSPLLANLLRLLRVGITPRGCPSVLSIPIFRVIPAVVLPDVFAILFDPLTPIFAYLLRVSSLPAIRAHIRAAPNLGRSTLPFACPAHRLSIELSCPVEVFGSPPPVQLSDALRMRFLACTVHSGVFVGASLPIATVAFANLVAVALSIFAGRLRLRGSTSGFITDGTLPPLSAADAPSPSARRGLYPIRRRPANAFSRGRGSPGWGRSATN